MLEESTTKHIGITGAEGHIGKVLRKGLTDPYSIHSFTQHSASFPSTAIDLSDPEKIKGVFRGLDAVIHLAADPNPAASWESVRKNNIESTYNVFEECVRSGVKRLIFASSNHVQHGNTMLTTPETLDPTKKIRMKLTDQPNPDSLYAVSKLTGEDFGKLYSDRYRLEFVALRIGWTIPEDDPTVKIGTSAEDYIRAMFLSQRDCVQAFRRALEVDTNFVIAYAISNNERRVFDLVETEKMLGFYPQDNAEDYFRRPHPLSIPELQYNKE